eukprot:GHVL01000533.1.p1 GENE.GHVL01000533.1~~GHVL01000533.1.p1  ORF type:complete len:128 (+),score=37.41 GHVL01000533.1:23-385(+)
MNNEEIVYWRVKLPWPLHRRDYVYIRRIKKIDNYIVSIIKSTKNINYPEKDNILRIRDQHSILTLTTIDSSDNFEAPGVKFALFYWDDPRVSIPKWATSLATGRALPAHIQAMHEAARKC